jgi:hypothetical protein
MIVLASFVLHFMCFSLQRMSPSLSAHQIQFPYTIIFFQALMAEIYDEDYLAIAWQYPGQKLEVIPAHYSRINRP